MTGKKTWAGRACCGLLAAALCLAAAGLMAAVPAGDGAAAGRADFIRIDALAAFGELERGPVPFFHERHTEALAGKGKDCTSCHLPEKQRLSFKFKRLEETGKQAVMDLYHDNCIGCHRETAKAGEKSGPVACAACHRQAPSESGRQPMGMDKSLHYRHAKALENQCRTCHHEYDEAAKKLVYVEGREGSCRYCHGPVQVENRIALRQAVHLDCVSCHLGRQAKNETAGPVTCSGCHDAAQQALIERPKTVPRLKRGQPDVTLVSFKNPDPPPAAYAQRPSMVPFDHKAHEAANDSCRVCHHAALSACAACHTAQGDAKGKFVNLQEAMHRPTAEAGCVGCHQRRQAEAACAGCHRSPVAPAPAEDRRSCAVCHLPPPEGAASAADKQQLAGVMLAARPATPEPYPLQDLPEVVEISGLSRHYDAVKLPHRRIVARLAAGAAQDRLAGRFHRDPATLCQGCHHNSPPGLKPPKCAACHGRPFEPREPLKPGLMAAYHIQCMNCHADMGLDRPAATNCTACHREKPR